MEGSWDAATGVGQVEPRTRRRLGALARDARRLAAGTAGAHIERKPAGIAFHDRRVPPGRLGAWRQRLRAWLADEDLDGLEVLRGRRVVELRVLGIHKGIVARRLLRDHGARSRDISLVAMGDDRTDEDLFREVGRRGLTVRVGRPGVRTAATERLPSPAAVGRFLVRLADLSDEL